MTSDLQLRRTFKKFQAMKLEIEHNKMNAKRLYKDYNKIFTDYGKCCSRIKELEKEIIDSI